MSLLKLALCAAAAMLIAGCGDDDSTTSNTVTETVTQSTEASTETTESTTSTTDVAAGPVGPLAPDALGPLPVESSPDEARAAFGEPDDIEEVSLGTGPAPQVTWIYEMSGGTVRLNFATETDELRQYVVTTPELETAEGIAVGSTQRDVVLAYGNGLPLAPIGDGLILSADGSDKPPALTFNFSGKQVEAITGGDILQPAGE